MIFNENGNAEEKKKKPASNMVQILQIYGEFRDNKINNCRKEWEMIQKCYKLCNTKSCYMDVSRFNNDFIRKWKDKPGEDVSCITKALDLSITLKDKIKNMGWND